MSLRSTPNHVIHLLTRQLSERDLASLATAFRHGNPAGAERQRRVQEFVALLRVGLRGMRDRAVRSAAGFAVTHPPGRRVLAVVAGEHYTGTLHAGVARAPPQFDIQTAHGRVAAVYIEYDTDDLVVTFMARVSPDIMRATRSLARGSDMRIEPYRPPRVSRRPLRV